MDTGGLRFGRRGCPRRAGPGPGAAATLSGSPTHSKPGRFHAATQRYRRWRRGPLLDPTGRLRWGWRRWRGAGEIRPQVHAAGDGGSARAGARGALAGVLGRRGHQRSGWHQLQRRQRRPRHVGRDRVRGRHAVGHRAQPVHGGRVDRDSRRSSLACRGRVEGQQGLEPRRNGGRYRAPALERAGRTGLRRHARRRRARSREHARLLHRRAVGSARRGRDGAAFRLREHAPNSQHRDARRPPPPPARP